MDFTREPIIESIITPKEGCKLVIRSSKGVGQEEFFVDAVEVVSFGHTFFLRSLERPKAFLVPATDYEILEVRETRMVLKNVGVDRSIKIGGGREAGKRAAKEPIAEEAAEAIPTEEGQEVKEARPEGRATEKRRERRKQQRKRRGREEVAVKEKEQPAEGIHEEKIDLPPPEHLVETEESLRTTTTILSTLLPPPPNLISETIERYRDNEMFKNVFFPKGEKLESEEEGQQEGESSDQEGHDRPDSDQFEPTDQPNLFDDDRYKDVNSSNEDRLL